MLTQDFLPKSDLADLLNLGFFSLGLAGRRDGSGYRQRGGKKNLSQKFLVLHVPAQARCARLGWHVQN